MKRNLEIGAGERPDKPRESWIWQDIRPLPHIELVCDAARLPLADNSIDEMYSNHVLEHFLCLDVEKIFRRWFAILAPQGRMTHHLPDFETMWKMWLDGYRFPSRHPQWQHLSPDMYVCLVTANGQAPQSHLNHLPARWYAKTLREIGYTIESIEHNEPMKDLPCLTIIAKKP